MSKIKIVGLCHDKEKILDLLTQSKIFELSKAEDIDDDFAMQQPPKLETFKQLQAEASFAIKYIAELKQEAILVNKQRKKRGLPPLKIEKESHAPLVLNKRTIENFDQNRQQMQSICKALQENQKQGQLLESKINDLTDQNKQLADYLPLPHPFSLFKDTNTTSFFIARSQSGQEIDIESLAKFDCYIEQFDSLDQNHDSKKTVWAIACPLDKKPALIKKLKSNEFFICPFDYDKSAKQIIDENFALIEKYKDEQSEKFVQGLSHQSALPSLKIYFDILGLEIEKQESFSKIFEFHQTVTIEGWAPTHSVSKLKNDILINFKSVDFEYRAAKKGDTPPSLSVNPKIFRPFEGVTKGYGVPSYGESDPSPIMAIFFFVSFGIMLADAGYGLIMALMGLIVGFASKKLGSGNKRMLLMLGICGISGVIFGVLFGGVFAIEGLPALWFNPMEEPITMLIFSLGLGVVHLLTGYTLKSIKTTRAHFRVATNAKAKVWGIFDGIFDSLFMYLLFGGVIVFALPMALGDSAIVDSFPFSTVAITMLAASLVGIVLTSGRRAPSIGGKVAGGLGGLYKLINVFSDVLSYSRLFGLALASGAIAMAFNQIGSLVLGLPIIGYPLGAIALIVLHLFNLLLAALAAYVHSIRLQYVEFFGKFYDGSGRSFSPLGSNVRYVKIENNG
ncbi:MAG: hypothetical protein FWD86_00830 [Firmicutes bacterium]|nr:hypothetical protein [Bacillota bacterium]